MTAQPTNLSGIDVRAEIERLRKERNAVILAHYYQSRKSRTWPISWAIRWSCRKRRQPPMPM